MEKADWSLWRDIPQAELWELVALSIDIEPNSLPIDRRCWGRPEVGDPFEDCPAEFKRRLKIAVAHLRAGTLPHKTLAFTNAPASDIKQSDFMLWARTVGWPPFGKNLITTGAPGRPTKGIHLCVDEFNRRAKEGLCELKLKDEADHLQRWFHDTHPERDPVKATSIENQIRAGHRDWKAKRPRPQN